MKRRELLKTSAALAAGTLITAACKSTSIKTSMTSQNKFAHLKSMAQDIEAPNAEDFAQRRERLRKELHTQESAALLVTGTTSLRYFTGVAHGNSDRLFGVLLFAKGEPIWICPAFEKTRALELLPPKQNIITWEEDADPTKLLGDILHKHGAATGPLAIEVETPYRYVDLLARNNPGLVLQSGFEPVRRCRMIKSAKEISIMRHMDLITKTALAEAAKHLQEGTSESEFRSWVREAHQRLGAESIWVIALFASNSAFPHGTQHERKLREGDIVLCDNGGALFGYQSDVTRTWVFGKANDRQRKVWDTVLQAQQAALKAARPGNTCEQVDQAARKVIEDAGFGANYQSFVHRLGHGIGMDGHEEPYMVRGNKLVLMPGMTSSNEPGIYLYDEFGVRLEDIMLITEDGAELFGAQSTAIDKPW